MPVDSVSNSNSAQYPSGSERVLPEKTLRQEDFFKLLIAQMTAQDPMNPISNAEFMGQMAQFSTLEQTRSLESQVAAMRTQQEILQANGMIGRDVELDIDGVAIQGTVTGVTIEDGTPLVVVNGHAYNLDSVLRISPAVTAVA